MTAVIDTTTGIPIETELLRKYLKRLVNQLFKILPMRENEETTLMIYMKSLQLELLGCKDLVTTLHDDAEYLSILSILQYLIDNPQCNVAKVKREIFRAISICNKLQSKFVLTEVPQ